MNSRRARIPFSSNKNLLRRLIPGILLAVISIVVSTWTTAALTRYTPPFDSRAVFMFSAMMILSVFFIDPSSYVHLHGSGLSVTDVFSFRIVALKCRNADCHAGSLTNEPKTEQKRSTMVATCVIGFQENIFNFR